LVNTLIIRGYGLEELRNHANWSEALALKWKSDPDFEIATGPILSLFSFRVSGLDDAGQISFVNRLIEFFRQRLYSPSSEQRKGYETWQTICIRAIYRTIWT